MIKRCEWKGRVRAMLWRGYSDHSRGFTLAELLIALGILAMIATFTIPKVIQSQQDSKFNAILKTTAGALSQAYIAYKAQNGANSSVHPKDLIPYLNYVKSDTTGANIDGPPGGGTNSCNSTEPCIFMHDGSKIWFHDVTFSGTNSYNYIPFLLDPDGTTTGNEDSIYITLYYDGRVTTWGTNLTNATDSEGTYGACPACDPTWFHQWQ